MNKPIPEILLEAAIIFLDELENHAQTLLPLLARLDGKTPLLVPTDLSKQKERFHTIKGGAGFLGLVDLAYSASRGEELLKQAQLDGPQQLELARIIQSLPQEQEKLRQQLNPTH